MQSRFADLEHAAKRKVTRRVRFLAEIETITPWPTLLGALEALYPKGGGHDHQPASAPQGLLLCEDIIIDAHSGLVHRLKKGTAANVSDVTQAHALMHGEECELFADAGYQGVENWDCKARLGSTARR